MFLVLLLLIILIFLKIRKMEGFIVVSLFELFRGIIIWFILNLLNGGVYFVV